MRKLFLSLGVMALMAGPSLALAKEAEAPAKPAISPTEVHLDPIYVGRSSAHNGPAIGSDAKPETAKDSVRTTGAQPTP